eukprot:scaffold14.g1234.t1
MPLQGKCCVITGANRGIGLEFVRQLEAKGNRVIAACRHPAQASELQKLPSVVVTQESVEEWAASVGALTRHVDVLINNAGVLRRVGFSEATPADFNFSFAVNAVGPMLTVQALHRAGLLGGAAPSLIAGVTSKMGSVDDNKSGGSYAYRASKAALNIITKNVLQLGAMRPTFRTPAFPCLLPQSLSVDLAPENITSTLLHPGWVQTDMTGGTGLIDAPTSVAGMLEVLERPAEQLNGAWTAWDGKEVPW